MGHIHAELMAQYAEDAKEHERPWELWEHGDGTEWTNCTAHPCWHKSHIYRRKPRTVKIGNHVVPEPCKAPPAYGQTYYVPLISTAGASRPRTWMNDSQDALALRSNLVHLNEESAETHAKALIEVSKGWWK